MPQTLNFPTPPPFIIIHGGAWDIPSPLLDLSVVGVEIAAREGLTILLNGGTALDAVEVSVQSMESDPVFDAGYGSALTRSGAVEMDAIICSGVSENFGAVACLTKCKSAVKVARKVMEDSEHTMFVGEGADDFGKLKCPEDVVGGEELISEYAREHWERFKDYKGPVNELFNKGEEQKHPGDTVGAVAVDKFGNFASATSTGGIPFCEGGRVGDSPLPGCGADADNEVGACSTTGHGESLSRVKASRRVMEKMENGATPGDAAEAVLERMLKVTGGRGGIIVAKANGGGVGFSFSTVKMPWAVGCEEWGDKIESGILPNGKK
ncbi:hypothetical protein TrST_g8784 [Triparma strigata]|uniref:Asparaginase n=1 Tax=Triparma strigata TaxID=1606541 RepID=A0A9W7AQ27_9STRA|nr:hypothetical protein TrST_g8784 [Triparma strigata]